MLVCVFVTGEEFNSARQLLLHDILPSAAHILDLVLLCSCSERGSKDPFAICIFVQIRLTLVWKSNQPIRSIDCCSSIQLLLY